MLDRGARRRRLRVTDEFRVDVHGWVHEIADTRIMEVHGGGYMKVDILRVEYCASLVESFVYLYSCKKITKFLNCGKTFFF